MNFIITPIFGKMIRSDLWIYVSIGSFKNHQLENNLPSPKQAVRTWKCAIPKGNEKVFQPSIFRCELLLVLGRVMVIYHGKIHKTCKKSPEWRCDHHLIYPILLFFMGFLKHQFGGWIHGFLQCRGPVGRWTSKRWAGQPIPTNRSWSKETSEIIPQYKRPYKWG